MSLTWHIIRHGMEKPKTKFIVWLEDAMHKRGGYDYRKSDLSRDLGVTAVTISVWFKGGVPDDENIRRLALHFRVNAAFLYDLLDRKPPPDYDPVSDAIMGIIYRLPTAAKARLLKEAQELEKYETKKKQGD